MATITIDGFLTHWTVYNNYEGKPLAKGQIQDDRKGRFDNGEFIYTSLIVSGPDINGVIKTENSVYRLVGDGVDQRKPYKANAQWYFRPKTENYGPFDTEVEAMAAYKEIVDED